MRSVRHTSILIGAAANKCFTTGQSVKIADLVTGLGRPDYAPMPPRAGPLPMPQRRTPRRGDGRSSAPG